MPYNLWIFNNFLLSPIWLAIFFNYWMNQDWVQDSILAWLWHYLHQTFDEIWAYKIGPFKLFERHGILVNLDVVSCNLPRNFGRQSSAVYRVPAMSHCWNADVSRGRPLLQPRLVRTLVGVPYSGSPSRDHDGLRIPPQRVRTACSRK